MQQYGLWKVYFPESFFVACYRANARDREEVKRIRGCTASTEFSIPGIYFPGFFAFYDFLLRFHLFDVFDFTCNF